MLRGVITLIIIAIVFAYFIQYRDWLDWNKKFIYRVTPGPCKFAATNGGSEDLTHIGNNVIMMSSGLFAGEGQGLVKTFNLNTNEMVNMTIRNAPERKDFMTSPHGITTWRDDNGDIYLYVLTHAVSEDIVEVFKVMGNDVLFYQKSIMDPSFYFMNDLVAVGRDQFYITKWWHFRQKALHIVEYMTQSVWGDVIYYDGQKGISVVPTGLFMPNGINISPDGKMIYVAEFGRKQLLGFHRSTDNYLTKAWTFDANSLVDNIEVDTVTGDLWIACHPLAYRIFSVMNDLLIEPLPSQVLRFKMVDNMVSKVEEIYADDGTELTGSSAATFVDGKLIIGTMYRQTLICDVNYLSK